MCTLQAERHADRERARGRGRQEERESERERDRGFPLSFSAKKSVMLRDREHCSSYLSLSLYVSQKSLKQKEKKKRENG
jgi:hypothetical protein